MSYRSERFNDALLSVDCVDEENDPSKDPRQSDGGASVERMIEAIDYTPSAALWEGREAVVDWLAKLDAARKRLERAGLGYLVPTLMLICKNGRNRGRSIREIANKRMLSFHAAEVRYFGHREKILNFFLGQ